MILAIIFNDGDSANLAAIRERRPRFFPGQVSHDAGVPPNASGGGAKSRDCALACCEGRMSGISGILEQKGETGTLKQIHRRAGL